MSVADFMALALGHPEHGYYMRREPFGRGGDFITAPEVSQIFGELLGLWAADTWLRMGSPAPVRLVELGPGRGTLMADALRALRSVPRFLRAMTLHLVETSERLREAQAEALRFSPAPLHWHGGVEEVPGGPAILLANEFFDALPVRQFVRTGTGWRERLVGLAGERLEFGLSPDPVPPSLVPERFRGAPPGAVWEISPAAIRMAQSLGARLAREGGAALIVDYGPSRSIPGATLQAVRAHARADPLADPGLADLTAHVDFEALGVAARSAGAAVFGPMTQAEFLQALGIGIRAAVLRTQATAEQSAAIDAAVERLTGPEAMGLLFKVLAIAAPGLDPAPFDSAAKEGDPPSHSGG